MRLNLGSGMYPLDGFINLDGVLGHSLYPLDVPDDTADEIRASHVLEHFGHRKTVLVLADWVRALKPGGLLKIAVPNFDTAVAEYQAFNANPSGNPPPIEGWILGGQTEEADYHAALFTESALRQAFDTLGLVDVEPWTSETDDCAAQPISLNLQGVKGGDCPAVIEGFPPDPVPVMPTELEASQVRAVMGVPRLGFTDMMFCAVAMARDLGIQLERAVGVYWGQRMSRLFDRAIGQGAKYILTLDYDSVFRTQDVIDLLGIMEQNPHVDAVCAVQMRRDGDSPLLALEKITGPQTIHVGITELEQPLLKLRTGHFGLTVLRVSSLVDLPRPWFLEVPDPAGVWGEERLDADISFWHAWAEKGYTLYQANRVVIGHAQLLVTWPTHLLRAGHQFTSEYNETGKPDWCWR